MITIIHVIALIVINSIGLGCILLIFILMRQKTPHPREKLALSIELGLIFIMIYGVISSDLGIYLWIKSGNILAMVLAIPLFICGSPLIFPLVVSGTYLQLIYRDKLQSFVDSHKFP